MREVNKSKRYKDGTVYDTINHGKITIVGQSDRAYKTNKGVAFFPYFYAAFSDKTVAVFAQTSIKQGSCKNKNTPFVSGIGYLGYGKYRANEVTKGKSVNTKAYRTWNNMIQRCYDAVWQSRHPSYIGCTVAPRWWCFQNFCADIETLDGYDIWKAEKVRMDLDKDIRIPGSRVYSKDTCKFVTPAENQCEMLDRVLNRKQKN